MELARSISVTERLILWFEDKIIHLFNLYLDSLGLEDPPFMVDSYQNFAAMAAEAADQFYELEVVKDEVVQMLEVWNSREKYLDTIAQLYHRMTRIRFADAAAEEAALVAKLTKQEENCKHKKMSLEYILTVSKEDDSTYDSRFGSKAQAVIRHLLKLHQEDPNAKALVFSQFTDFLGQLAILLKNHELNFICGRSIPGVHVFGSIAERINQFKNDPAITVCLLNTVKQATGLTLTQASFVYLADPAGDADEMQAIGRAWRIGQEKTTSIIRFITRNTIEEEDYHFQQSEFLRKSQEMEGSQEENFFDNMNAIKEELI